MHELPPGSHDEETRYHEAVAYKVYEHEHRRAAAQQCDPEMPALVGKGVKGGILRPEYNREDVDGQGKAIHLRKEGDYEGGRNPHGPPLPPLYRSKEAQDEEEEEEDIYDYKRPEPVSIRKRVPVHGLTSQRFLVAFWRRTLWFFDYLLPPFLTRLRVLDALFLLELVPAGLGAEVKGLVLAMGVEPGLFFIHVHAAYRVLCHIDLL